MLWLTRHTMNGVCPERPSGVKGLSSNPTKDLYPASPDLVGEEHRDDGPLLLLVQASTFGRCCGR